MTISKFMLLSILFMQTGCHITPKQKVEVIKIDGLQKLIAEDKHTLHVINFWATWCKPCVKELPLFVSLNESHPGLSISLVSLDFIDEIETKLYPFLDKNDINLRVLLMDEVDYNLWINMVDSSWSGAIPATFFIEPSTGRRKFLEKEFENGELEKEIETFIKIKNDD